jgi:hypothetical protein
MATEPYQNSSSRHDAPEPSAVEARQGLISGRVFLVLVTSLILAVIVMVIGYFVVR